MRSQRVVIVILCMLAFAGAAHAADLQAGWYVKLGGVAVYGWYQGQYVGVDWNFTSPLGTYGPFEVTQPDQLWPQRMVLVPSAAFGVPVGTYVDLGGELEAPVTFAVDRLDLSYETNYDASRLRLEVLSRHPNGQEDLLWYQSRSGYAIGGPSLYNPSLSFFTGDILVCRVVVVPEPAYAMTLGLAGLAFVSWRRRGETR